MLADERKRSRSPFTEKLLRPPGESLRLQVEELREDLTEICFKLGLYLVGPAVFLMLFRIEAPSPRLITVILVFAIGWSLAWREWRRLSKLRVKLRNARLGFDGERFVAAELTTLLAQGYRVFHDFGVDWLAGDRTHNIDHIVVGPPGVFAIETKAWRKPLGTDEVPRLRVTSKGIQKPGDMPRMDTIHQAKRNADTLSKWLTGTAKELVPVRPLVVIPGWFIENDDWQRCGVQTLSGLARRFAGLQRNPSLTAAQIQQYGDQIEAHCRTTEVAT